MWGRRAGAWFIILASLATWVLVLLIYWGLCELQII